MKNGLGPVIVNHQHVHQLLKIRGGCPAWKSDEASVHSKGRVPTSPAIRGSEEGQHSGGSNGPGIVDNQFQGEGFEEIVQGDPIGYLASGGV